MNVLLICFQIQAQIDFPKALIMKKEKKQYNYLEMTPFTLYSHELREDGNINVFVPKFTDKILSRLLMPRIRKPYIKANLDEFGSHAWLLFNGENKVNEIADKLLDEFGEKIQPAKERLISFLTNLYHAGFISFKELNKE